MGSEKKAIQETIEKHRYDAKIIPQLETYVLFQTKSGSYDFDANRHLLKLYMFSPESTKIDILSKILVKALMALPQMDFLACTHLVPEKLHETEPVKTLLKLHSLLDSTQFKKFWKELSSTKETADVTGFSEAIRTFMATVIQSTFQNISVASLKELLNLDDKALSQFCSAQGWKVSDKTVTIPLEQSKATARGNDKLSLEQTSKVLSRLGV